MTLLNVTPIAPIKHIGHDAAPDAENRVYLLYRGCRAQSPDCSRNVLCDCRLFVTLSSRDRAMPRLIGGIFARRSPPKIRRAVISAVSVVMTGLMARRWRWPVEGATNTPMDGERRSSRAVVRVKNYVAVPLDARLDNCSAVQLSDPSKIADFVRPTGDRSPFFGRCVHA